jgi:hypothetical protein
MDGQKDPKKQKKDIDRKGGESSKEMENDEDVEETDKE